MSLRDASLHRKFSKASQRKTPVLCYLPGLRGGCVAGTKNALICTHVHATQPEVSPHCPGCPCRRLRWPGPLQSLLIEP